MCISGSQSVSLRRVGRPQPKAGLLEEKGNTLLSAKMIEKFLFGIFSFALSSFLSQTGNRSRAKCGFKVNLYPTHAEQSCVHLLQSPTQKKPSFIPSGTLSTQSQPCLPSNHSLLAQTRESSFKPVSLHYRFCYYSFRITSCKT